MVRFRRNRQEGNPIFGKHPSAKKLILAKVGLGALHFVAFKALNDRNPRAALRLAQVSCAVQAEWRCSTSGLGFRRAVPEQATNPARHTLVVVMSWVSAASVITLGKYPALTIVNRSVARLQAR